MTIQDATKIVYLIHTAYPQDRNATERELLDRIDLWAVILADYDVNLVTRVVKSWIKASRYMPNFEEIKKACDIQKALDAKLAEAGNIHDIKVTPELEARLDEIWDSVAESERIGEKANDN